MNKIEERKINNEEQIAKEDMNTPRKNSLLAALSHIRSNDSGSANSQDGGNNQ